VVARVLAAGGASLAVIVLFAAMWYVSSGSRNINIRQPASSGLARDLNKPQATTLWPSWTVTMANSAHHALVVDVEARRVEQARLIAEQIVEPVRSRGYQEILIYIRKAGDPEAPMRRVQWTPRTGYVESAYGRAPALSEVEGR
jgi:hypothetical protein